MKKIYGKLIFPLEHPLKRDFFFAEFMTQYFYHFFDIYTIMSQMLVENRKIAKNFLLGQ